MAQTVPQLQTQPRDKVGSRYAQRLRADGRLPAVIYGHGHDPVHVSVNARELHDVLAEHAHVVEVIVDGNPQPCLIKDVQYDYLDRDPVHADLAIVNLDEEVEVEIGLDLIGDAVGLKTAGALMDQHYTELSVRCKARDIPEVITHDVSAMQAGDILHARDITLPEGVALAMDAEAIVAMIEVRTAVEEETPAVEAAATAEPVVITKGKKEEEAAAGKGAAPAGKGAAPGKK